MWRKVFGPSQNNQVNPNLAMAKEVAVILAVFLLINEKAHAMDTGAEFTIPEEGKCQSDRFPCYGDCCLRGEQFCNAREERCFHCDTRRVLCGNDSLPLPCMLYCHLTQHPANQEAENPSLLLSWAIFISIVSVIIGVIIGAVCTLCVLVKRPLHKCPVCIRKLLGHSTGMSTKVAFLRTSSFG